MGTIWILAIIIGAVIGIAQSVDKANKTGSWKSGVWGATSQRKKYQSEKTDLELHFMKTDPDYWHGDFKKKTGQYNPDYLKAIKDLNEKYAMPGSDEYKKICEREKLYEQGKL
jgi:hypothetical protein